MGPSSLQFRDPGCLDDPTIAAFAEGSLEGDALQRAEAHISNCERCRGILGDAAYGLSASSKSVSVTSLPGLGGLGLVTLPAPGAILAGKYKVEETLGKGGMGAVFAARHLELGNRVAIKVLFRGEGDGAARFLREAQTCARLTSENVVRVFDMGRLPTGAPYLVMEHLTGKDLGRLVREGPVEMIDAVSYVLQACAGLSEAHAVGVVHRDLKPANLFLTTRGDGSPLVKVLDFGVSKVLHNEGSGELSITTTQSLVGSPLFMSPEQIRDSKEVDARTDIWSLGVILYQLLTRNLPFPERTLPALLLAIGAAAPKPPSALRPGIPPALDACVLRCLEKDRGFRYQTLGELARDLAPFGSIQARALAERVHRISTTSPPPLAISTSPLATTGTSVSDATPFRAEKPRSRAVLFGALAALVLVGAGSAGVIAKKEIAKRNGMTGAAASPGPNATPSAMAIPSAVPSAVSGAGPTQGAGPTPSVSATTGASVSANPASTANAKGHGGAHKPPPAGTTARPAGQRLPGPTDTPD